MLNWSYGHPHPHPQASMESLTHTPPIYTIFCRELLAIIGKLCPQFNTWFEPSLEYKSKPKPSFHFSPKAPLKLPSLHTSLSLLIPPLYSTSRTRNCLFLEEKSSIKAQVQPWRREGGEGVLEEGDSSSNLFHSSLLIPPLRRKKSPSKVKFGCNFIQCLVMLWVFAMKWFSMQKSSMVMETLWFLNLLKERVRRRIFSSHPTLQD